EEVGGNQHVGLERGGRWPGALRQRREGPERLRAAARASREQSRLAHDTGDAPSPQAPQQMPHRGGGLDEHDGLPGVVAEQRRERDSLGVITGQGDLALSTCIRSVILYMWT